MLSAIYLIHLVTQNNDTNVQSIKFSSQFRNLYLQDH